MQNDFPHLPKIITAAEAIADAAAPWPAPRALGSLPPTALDLDAALPASLRPTLGAFIAATAEALQLDPAAVAPLCLGIVSGCIGRTIETEARPGWIETASLWFAVLLPAGERKSALVSALSRPVTDWQRDEAERLRAALASYAERRRVVEAELVSTRGQLAKKGRGTPEREELQNKVSDLAEELDRLPPLAPPSLVVSDFTPESLRDLLRQNGEKAIWIAPEADAPALLGSRYSNAGANFDLLLKGHCGDAAPASRVGRDVSLERPALALALCVQPAALESVLRDAYARDKGLIPRLLLVTPRSLLGTRRNDAPTVPEHLAAWWGETLQGLLDLTWPGKVVSVLGTLTRCETGPRILTLTAEASAHLDALRSAIEPRLAEDGDLRPVAAFASKLPGAVVRIATAFALLAGRNAETVNGEEMRAACAWSDFLLAHFRHALGTAAEPDERKLALRILATIRRKGWGEFSSRDALREVDGGGGVKAEDVGEALAVLAEADWIRPAPAPSRDPGEVLRGGRPPSARWQVNPALFSAN